MAIYKPITVVSGKLQRRQSDDAVDIGYAVHGFKNRIFNGSFSQLRRGASFTGNNQYTAERWYITSDGVQGSRTATAAGGALNINQTVAGSGQTFNRLLQRVEDTSTLANGRATVSLWASGSGVLSVALAQVFNGSPTTTVTGGAVTLSGVPTRYQWVFDLPSTTGKTLGAGHHLAVQLRLPVNTTYNITLRDVQLEYGSNATDFEYRPLQIEEMLCNRYFTVRSEDLTGIFNIKQNFIGAVTFLPSMRVVPTTTISTLTPVVTLPDVGTEAAVAATTAPTLGTGGGLVKITGFNGTQNRLGYLSTGEVRFEAEL